MSTIQFIIDLVWQLRTSCCAEFMERAAQQELSGLSVSTESDVEMKTTEEKDFVVSNSLTSKSIDLIFDSMSDLVQVVMKLNLSVTVSNRIIMSLNWLLLQIIDDLGLFNQVDDTNNSNLFKNWCKTLLHQTFKCKFKLAS